MWSWALANNTFPKSYDLILILIVLTYCKTEAKSFHNRNYNLYLYYDLYYTPTQRLTTYIVMSYIKCIIVSFCLVKIKHKLLSQKKDSQYLAYYPNNFFSSQSKWSSSEGLYLFYDRIFIWFLRASFKSYNNYSVDFWRNIWIDGQSLLGLRSNNF